MTNLEMFKKNAIIQLRNKDGEITHVNWEGKVLFVKFSDGTFCHGAVVEARSEVIRFSATPHCEEIRFNLSEVEKITDCGAVVNWHDKEEMAPFYKNI